jgi:DNA primase
MAGRIPQAFIDDLLARVDIVDVVDSRVPLKKQGREFAACCPFHDEKTPSFYVSPTKQFYHCFGCGAHGNAVGFLMEYEHMEFLEALQELASRVGMELPEREQDGAPRGPSNQGLYDLLEQAAGFYRKQLRDHPTGPGAIEYLKGRGLDGEIAKAFRIGFAPPEWDGLIGALASHPAARRLAEAGMVVERDGKRYDRFRNRIMFPIRDARGRVIAFGGRTLPEAQAEGDSGGAAGPKYLNSPETPVFQKKKELYGLYEARQALRSLPRLLVVEGYMDVVSLAQFGVRYAVATLGTSVTPEHMQRLFRTAPEVVFCFDGDRAGREAAWRGLENALPLMSGGRQLRFMFLPEGEDPDTLIRRVGPEQFEALVARAEPLSEFMIKGLAQQADLTSVDGKARLVELAKPLLSKLPAGGYRELVLQGLESYTKLRLEAGQLLNGGSAGAHPAPVRRRPPSGGRQAPSLVRQALTLVLHEPALAQKAGSTERFSDLQQPGIRLLCEVIELLQSNPNLTLGSLLEYWRERTEGRHLAALAAREPLLGEGGNLEEEFHDALELLARQRVRQRREQLQRKPFRELSAEEKLELQQLIKEENRQ